MKTLIAFLELESAIWTSREFFLTTAEISKLASLKLAQDLFRARFFGSS